MDLLSESFLDKIEESKNIFGALGFIFGALWHQQEKHNWKNNKWKNNKNTINNKLETRLNNQMERKK